jgi:hypothetical protein
VLNRSARVVQADNAASNGTIHVIDRVCSRRVAARGRSSPGAKARGCSASAFGPVRSGGLRRAREVAGYQHVDVELRPLHAVEREAGLAVGGRQALGEAAVARLLGRFSDGETRTRTGDTTIFSPDAKPL